MLNGWLMAEVLMKRHLKNYKGRFICSHEEGDVRMFMGKYSHTIDAKGRMIIPAGKFQEKSWEKNSCLPRLDVFVVHYQQRMEAFEEKLKEALPIIVKNARAFLRFFVVLPCELDKRENTHCQNVANSLVSIKTWY